MTTTTIAYTLAGLIGAGIIFIGARFIVAPASPPPATVCNKISPSPPPAPTYTSKASATSHRGCSSSS